MAGKLALFRLQQREALGGIAALFRRATGEKVLQTFGSLRLPGEEIPGDAAYAAQG
jgi:hypothetical protein